MTMPQYNIRGSLIKLAKYDHPGLPAEIRTVDLFAGREIRIISQLIDPIRRPSVWA